MTRVYIALIALFCGACGSVGSNACRSTQPVTRSLLIANSVAHWQRLRMTEQITAEELAATIRPGCCSVEKLDDSLLRRLFDEHGSSTYRVEYAWTRPWNEKHITYSRETWLNECGDVKADRSGSFPFTKPE